jgi:Spy/CpxP family protein refolding chaperone
MRFRSVLVLAAVLVMVSASVTWAQPGRGRGGPGGFGRGGPGGGFGMSRLALLRIEAVQKELELLDDQIEAIRKLAEELRGDRGGQFGPGRRGPAGGEGEGGRRGRGRRGGGEQGDTTAVELPGGQFFVQQREGRGQRGFQDLSEEERERMREEFRKRAEERAKLEKEKLAEILLPHQLKRLNEIYVQVLGVRALQDADVANELKITDKQKKDMEEAQAAARESMGAEMRELFQSGDREKIQAKMAELRKKSDEKVLAVLTAQQKKKFEEMKGKPFELPEGALRGAFGGPGGPAGQGAPGRPQRPAADN